MLRVKIGFFLLLICWIKRFEASIKNALKSSNYLLYLVSYLYLVHAIKIFWVLKLKHSGSGTVLGDHIAEKQTLFDQILRDCGKTKNKSWEEQQKKMHCLLLPVNCRLPPVFMQLDAKLISPIIVLCHYRWVTLDWASDWSWLQWILHTHCFPFSIWGSGKPTCLLHNESFISTECSPWYTCSWVLLSNSF